MLKAWVLIPQRPRNKRQKATKKCQSLVNHRVYKTFFFYPRQFLTE